MSRTWMCALVIMAIGTEAARADEAWERAIASRLHRRVSVSFKDTTLRDTVACLRDLGGFNMVLDARPCGDAEPQVTLEVKDLELGNVLALIEEQCALHRVLRDGVMLWTTESLIVPAVVRVYAVNDLLFALNDFKGPRLRPASENVSYCVCCFWVADEPKVAVSRNELEDLVRADIGAAWDRHPDASLTIAHGKLIVTHTPEVQRRVAQYLRMLRRDR